MMIDIKKSEAKNNFRFIPLNDLRISSTFKY